MPRVQVLKARTPCCGKVVRLRDNSVGKSYLIVCDHHPKGQKMTVVENFRGARACLWENSVAGL
jgi:hypothetical protein